MSEYHKASELLGQSAKPAKPDWTTPEGIVRSLRDQLELDGYGTMFQMYRGNTPLPVEEARQAVVDAVVDTPYQDALRRMTDKDPHISWQPFVENDPEGLMFVHGDFRGRINLADDIRVAGPTGGRRKTRRQQQIEERAQALERKRRDIQGTDDDDYLAHANQCGWLLKNVQLDFLRSRKMRGTAVKMKVYHTTLEQLQSFIDATGRPSLAALSTHEGTQPGSDDVGQHLYSGWIDFAREIIDFLNLEPMIDVDALKAQHRDIGGDTGFRNLGKWGAGTDTVIGQLVDQRPDIDANMIRYFFTEGLGGVLTDAAESGGAAKAAARIPEWRQWRRAAHIQPGYD